MSMLSELWENKNIRFAAVFGVMGLLIVFIGLSMTDEKEVEAVLNKDPEPQQGSFFGISANSAKLSQEEASDMVSMVTDDFDKRERQRRATEEEMRRENRQLANRMAEQERVNNEMRLQLEALAKGQGTVQTRRTPTQAQQRANPQNQPPAQTQQSMEDARLANSNQTQIITRGTSANSPIIRTVTQRAITTIKDGEVTQQNVELNTINGRGSSGRVQPFSPDYREPLQKFEEEGLELFTLSMGSIISGTLLNGVAAPTSSDSKGDPMPVLMRIKQEAIMPNSFTLDIIDCHMLGSAIGDLGSSRVLIRAEAISCNTHTGEAIEKRIMAYAVDSSDGMAGIEGDVVFKSGAMIANSLKAEFISGFADAFSPQQVQALNTSPSATTLWQTQNIDRAAGAGIGKGFSGAADRIAEYYLTLAEQAHPVIELVPGIEVDFIVQKGMTLRLGGREAPYTNNRMEGNNSLSANGFQPPSVNVSGQDGPSVTLKLD
jgi:conjugal transfer pilus assembly protein TraB